MDNDTIAIQKLEKIAISLINTEYPEEIPSEEIIRLQLSAARMIYPRVTDAQFENAFRSICAKIRFTMDTGTAVIDPGTFKPWLDSRRSEINFYYWERYRDYLLNEKGWNSKIVSSLSRITDEILDLIGNPKSQDNFQLRGLIMGDVQSGKTATYTALCNKAMDAGYKVIIILAGIQENLRRQTQERLDIELVGLESERFLNKVDKKLVPKGVGRIDAKHFVATFTSKNNDFDQMLLNTLNLLIKNYSEPVLFVVKKQKTRLEYLEKWLRTFNTEPDGSIDLPVLIIDDESDNASINVNNDENKTTAINGAIRKLLKLFKKASYIGITATPFANIFIDPDSETEMLGDDLFPRDFIYSLSPPSNYIGNNAVFGETPTHSKIIEIIDDAEPIIPLSHPISLQLEILPDSLYRAISHFFLANIVRDLRGDITAHRSMLINISRFTIVHHQIMNIIQGYLEKIKSDVQNYAMLPVSEACKITSINALRIIWEGSNYEKRSGKKWKEIQQRFLYRGIAPIKVVEVNRSTGAASLDYTPFKDTGLRVIAIGGNSLSRGITLEGLCVSYFYRNSKAYDTLLQMGRWFGYRDNYDDLCRLFISAEARDCYTQITAATNGLRDQILVMNRNKMTPKEFGLMVRSSPENVDIMIRKLIVTARNKMRNTSEIAHMVSVSGKLMETPRIPNNISILVNNYVAITSFLTVLKKGFKQIDNSDKRIFHAKHPMWSDIPAREVSSFIQQFTADPLYLNFQGTTLAEYIKNAEHLSLWDVVIPGGDSESFDILEDIKVKPERRLVDIKNSSLRINGEKARVGSRSTSRFGLSEETIINIDKEYKKDNKTTPDIAYLIKDRNPLLMIHFIEIDGQKNEEVNKIKDELKNRNVMLTAIGIGFPLFDDPGTKKVKYVINKIMEMQLSMFYIGESEDED